MRPDSMARALAEADRHGGAVAALGARGTRLDLDGNRAAFAAFVAQGWGATGPGGALAEVMALQRLADEIECAAGTGLDPGGGAQSRRRAAT